LQVETALQVVETLAVAVAAGLQQLVSQDHQSQVMVETEQHLQFQVLL
jgi:hypothetical protein